MMTITKARIQARSIIGPVVRVAAGKQGITWGFTIEGVSQWIGGFRHARTWRKRMMDALVRDLMAA